MPAVSIDTFFACALMIIVVVSAMAGTSKLLSPYLSNPADEAADRRYREIAQYILIYSGKPENWGQTSETTPEAFGLANAVTDNLYDLDVDKVSRLNSENDYSLAYADIFTSLGFYDVSIKIEIATIFELGINLTATFESATEATYQFEILTQKDGSPVQSNLKCYVVAENYLDATDYTYSDGEHHQNITLSSSINGPALLAVIARSTYNPHAFCFGGYSFAHQSSEPESPGTYCRLSPLNHTLNARAMDSNVSLSTAYAFTFYHNATLIQLAANNESVVYEIPQFADKSPVILVTTGWNSTIFFEEWTIYPQIPLHIGANFDAQTLSDVHVYSFLITIDSVMYRCIISIGGPET